MFDGEFFPTPAHIVAKMLDRVSEDAIHFSRTERRQGRHRRGHHRPPPAGPGGLHRAVARSWCPS